MKINYTILQTQGAWKNWKIPEFLLLLFITAFGQPDRNPLFSLLAYLVGYSGFFYFLLSIEERKVRFFLAFFFTFFLQMIQLSWLSTTYYHGAGILVIYGLICLIIAIHIALVTLVLPRQGPMGISRALLLAAVWTIVEYSRLYYSCGFPFNTVGLVLTFEPNFMQLASVFGVYGLTFWVIFTAAIGASCWKTHSFSLANLWFFLLLFPYIFGCVHIHVRSHQMQNSPSMDVALIQTGLSAEKKWPLKGFEKEALSEIEQWEKIFAYLKKGKKATFDLIVLPEVALPGEAYDPSLPFEEVTKKIFQERDRLPPLEEPLAKKVGNTWLVSNVWMAQALANHYRSEIVIGLLDHEEKGMKNFNSAFHFQPFRTSTIRYDKRVLVPLAEYLPFRVMGSFLARFGITAFFTPGSEAKVFYGQCPLSPSICYEEGFSHLIREARKKGAKMLINLSNDGWFPHSRLPIEHFNLGRLRAIENGAVVLRSCNTGVTAAIDSLGRVVEVLQEKDANGNFAAGALMTTINQYSYATPFTYFGNSLILGISVLIILVSLLQSKISIDKKREHGLSY